MKTQEQNLWHIPLHHMPTLLQLLASSDDMEYVFICIPALLIYSASNFVAVGQDATVIY